MRFQWSLFKLHANSIVADEYLLQKITATATATAPSDAQKSNMARTHNAGAAALVMHRGQENCKSSLSIGLLFSVRSQLVSVDPSHDQPWLRGSRSNMPSKKAPPSRDALTP